MFDIDTCFGFHPAREVDGSPERLVSRLSRWGIRMALTCSLRGAFYDGHEGNRETLEICRRHPSLIPNATLDPRKVEDAEREVQAIVEQGFRAIRIFPELQNWDVASQSFRRVIEAMERHGMILVTSEQPSRFVGITRPVSIPILFTSVHSYQLAETLAVFRERPTFLAGSKQMISPDSIEIFVRELGAERLLFGSGTPLDCTGASLFRLLSAEIPETAREEILGGNARRLLCIAE